jgi:hypothetical protein
VRDALWYAHRALSSKQYPEAQANLNEARKALATYSAITGGADRQELNALSQEIAEAQQQIATPGAETHLETSRRVERALQRMLHLFGRGTFSTRHPPQPILPAEDRQGTGFKGPTGGDGVITTLVLRALPVACPPIFCIDRILDRATPARPTQTHDSI